MSGVLKGIGKVFKKVVKTVKKVALPALAIGAIVLTGGAALGVIGGAGGLSGMLTGGLGALGINSPALAGILTTAAKGATMGALGSAVTGGNIMKGATTGFLTGGVIGGIGSALSGPAAAGGKLTVAQAAARGVPLNEFGGIDQFAAAGGVDAAGAAGAVPGAAAVSGGVGSGLVQTAGGGGFLNFLNQNPVLAGNMIQGIGGGLMASQQAKDARRSDQLDRESYEGFTGSRTPTIVDAGPAGIASPYIEIDPTTGRIVPKRS